MDRDKLFEQFSPLLQRLIREYGTTPDRRQDLLGELYYLFHIFLDRYDPSRGIPLHAYLVNQMRVSAFTLARKEWRRERHEASLSETEDGEYGLPVTDPTPEWDDLMLQREIGMRLHTLIQSLPLRQKQVLVLRYCEDCTYEEITQIMGIQMSSARSLLRHALKRMREQVTSDQPCS